MRASGFVLAVLAAAAVGAAGCTDFPLPSNLDHEEILALRADPPIVEAGGRAALGALVAGPDGEVAAAPRWEAASLVPGAEPVGRVEVDEEGGAWYIAPEELPDGMPTAGVVSVTVDGTDGRELVGVKVVGVGLPPTANPVVAAITVDGVAVGDDGVMEVAAGAQPALEVSVSPAGGDQTTYAWFSTVGEVDPYRRADTTLAAPAAAVEGWLFVVVRDGVGGTAWKAARVVVVE